MNDTDIEKVLDRLVWLNARQAEYKREAEDLKAFLRVQVGKVERARIGGHSLTIRPNIRFSAQLAMERLTNEELALVSVQTVDSGRARTMLPPARYVVCQEETGEMIVRVT